MADQARTLLEEVFWSLELGVVVIDRRHRILAINPWLAKENGLPVDEHKGRTVREVTPELAPHIERVLEQVFETGEPTSAEIVEGTLRLGGGGHVWHGTYTPVRRDGRIVAVAVAVVDATARRLAEDALRKSEAQFRAICEASPVGIFLTNEQAISLYSNPENLRQMGLTAEEAAGFGWQRAIHPEDRARVQEEFGRAMAERRTYASIDRYLQPSGRVVYVDVKANAVRDGDAVVGHLGIVEDITERLAAESALRESELRFRQLADHIDSVFWLREPGKIHYVSPAFTEIWGRPTAAALADESLLLDSVHPEDRARVATAMMTPQRNEIEYRIMRPDGSVRWIHDRSFPIRDASAGPGAEASAGVGVKAVITTDVTRQKALETQLLQTQKLDSIGRLAGGIAHDFNNLLTVILGQTKMAMRAFEAGRSAIDELTQIDEAATRAAELTAQLLTFARRQVTHRMALDPRAVALDAERLLRRVLGDDITLVMKHDADVALVRADRSQLEQVLVNLAVNARDAMPSGGTLTIEMRNVTLDRMDVPRGAYVVLSVTDTGQGIAPADRERIFDPFFTTKPPGKGTGLGLATCYGIVKQHGGLIEVESEVGNGASFHVYLPRIDARGTPQSGARASVSSAVERDKLVGRASVLVVEDEASVRAVAVRALVDHGFYAVEADSGEEALAVLAACGGAVDIIVTDVVMRGMGGRELARRVRQDYPAIRILLTSGCAEDLGGLPFLQKPYVPAALVRRVRELLDTGPLVLHE